MPNRKIKHIVAKLVGASTEETLDVYDVDAVHTDKIYNGLDQTTAGYVLDARQGKALNDSLNDKLEFGGTSTSFRVAQSANDIGYRGTDSDGNYWTLVCNNSSLYLQRYNGSSTNIAWQLNGTPGTLIYRGNQIRETTTITGMGALSSWDIVNLLWRANVENETYPMTIFPKMASNVTFVTAHFDNGVYWENVRVWGGSNNVLGVAVDSFKDSNWKPGIIQIIGYKF